MGAEERCFDEDPSGWLHYATFWVAVRVRLSHGSARQKYVPLLLARRPEHGELHHV